MTEPRYFVQANTIFRRRPNAYPLAMDQHQVAELLNTLDPPPAEVSPDAPGEIWAVSTAGDLTWLVPPIDDVGCDVFIGCRSREDAELLADHQLQWYEERPVPVRLK